MRDEVESELRDAVESQGGFTAGVARATSLGAASPSQRYVVVSIDCLGPGSDVQHLDTWRKWTKIFVFRFKSGHKKEEKLRENKSLYRSRNQKLESLSYAWLQTFFLVTCVKFFCPSFSSCLLTVCMHVEKIHRVKRWKSAVAACASASRYDMNH